MEQKQTAVEWLSEQLWKTPQYETEWQKIIEQAKQMEKKQIVDAYRFGHIFHDTNDFDSAEQYYNEEYGGNNEQQ